MPYRTGTTICFQFLNIQHYVDGGLNRWSGSYVHIIGNSRDKR